MAETFEQQVATAAKDAGIPPETPMTAEEEAVPVQTWASNREKEEPAPEIKPEPAPVVEKPPEPAAPQTVPLAVHIRQRERMDNEIRELRRITEVGNQRLQEITRALSPAPTPIERATDPLGATLESVDKLQQEVKEINDRSAKAQQEEQNRAAIAQFNRYVAADEQEYLKQAPDLVEAINYAKGVKFREYNVLGLDPHQAAAKVEQDAFALAQHALNTGRSPSELVYAVAKELGYRKAAAAAEPAKPEPTQAETAVEMRKAGAERGKASGGAGTSGGPISFAELAALDNDEFAKMTSGKKWGRLLGST